MPRPFSDQEKLRIRARLLDAAKRAFGNAGLRQTSIESLAQAAGISKGAFYLFFPSKEALFLTVLEQVEETMRKDVHREIADRPDQALNIIFTTALTMRVREPILEHFALEDAAILMRSLPDDQQAQLLASDVTFAAAIIDQLRSLNHPLSVSADVLAGLLRSLFFLSLQSDQIGPTFPAVCDLLNRSLSDTLTREALRDGDSA